MKNVAAYCRVSTVKEDQLNSLTAQKLFFEEFANKQKGNSLVEIYADEGLSGTKIKNRKEFLRMMQEAKSGKFDILLVKDVSRFARNTVDLLQSVRRLKELDIIINFVNYPQITMDNAELLLTMMAGIAQEESRNTSVRIKAAKKANAQKGRVPNIVFGYDKRENNIFELDINKKEAAIVRQIFDLYINDGYGAGKIATMLNNKGIRTKRSSNWTQTAIVRILKNELYTGKVINGKQEIKDFLTSKRVDKDKEDWFIIDNPKMKIIEQEIFDKAQKILTNRKDAFQKDRTRYNNKHLFSTLIKCNECNYSFRRLSRTYKNTYNTWVCSNRNLNGVDSCNNSTILSEEDLIHDIRNYFINIAEGKKTFVKNTLDKVNTMFNAKQQKGSSATDLYKEILDIDKKREKYIELYADGSILKDEFNKYTNGLLERKQQLEAELRVIKAHSIRESELDNIINNTLKDIDKIISIENMTNVQLKRIIDKIEVSSDGKIDIKLKMFSEI